jgi:hypothetical protein
VKPQPLNSKQDENVIAITLNFKTIEAARQALLEIPASSLVVTPAPAPEAAPAPAPVIVQEPTSAPKAEMAAASATSPAIVEKVAVQEPKTPSVEVSTTSSAVASGANDSATVEYPVLQKAVFALAGKSREAAAAVASGFGVKTFKDLPSEKWADALAAVNAKLAEIEAA